MRLIVGVDNIYIYIYILSRTETPTSRNRYISYNILRGAYRGRFNVEHVYEYDNNRMHEEYAVLTLQRALKWINRVREINVSAAH